MSTWLLAVDESGDLSDPQSPALVGGVLINTRDTARWQQSLRGAIERACPGVVWPPHATDLRIPTTWAVHAALGAARASSDALRAARLLPQLAAVPPQEELRRLDQEVQRLSPRDHAALRRLSLAGAAAMADLLAAVGGDGLGGGACVVAAWEAAGAAPTDREERYRALFRALAERVELLLARRDGSPTAVQVRTARFFGVDATRLGDATVRAPRVAAGVQWVPVDPEGYGHQVHPSLVLADFVTNRLNRILRSGPWDRVATEVRQDTGLAGAAPAPAWAQGPLPSIASLGLPATAIHAALAGHPVDEAALVAAKPPWTGQQARAWVGAISAARSPVEAA